MHLLTRLPAVGHVTARHRRHWDDAHGVDQLPPGTGIAEDVEMASPACTTWGAGSAGSTPAVSSHYGSHRIASAGFQDRVASPAVRQLGSDDRHAGAVRRGYVCREARPALYRSAGVVGFQAAVEPLVRRRPEG